MPSTRANGYRAVAVGLLLLAAAAATPAAAQSETVTFTTVEDTVRVTATGDASVEGSADLPPGTELTVRLRSTGDTQPRFLRSETVTVGEDGEFAAEVDLSEQSVGNTLSVTVVRNGTEVASAEGRVVAVDVPTTPTASATPTPGGETTRAVPGFGTLVAALAVAGAAALAAVRARR